MQTGCVWESGNPSGKSSLKQLHDIPVIISEQERSRTRRSSQSLCNLLMGVGLDEPSRPAAIFALKCERQSDELDRADHVVFFVAVHDIYT